MENQLPVIAVLLTCYNRKEKTISCLKAFLAQHGLTELYQADVFLVDDGSTDGTGQAVKDQFPQVNVIRSDGNLFWNRGMHLAWKTAAERKEYDFYLWLNDDTFLFQQAVSEMLKSCTDGASIICGSTRGEFDQQITYGGFVRNPSRLLIPDGTVQPCAYFNGNCVLIPSAAYKKLGMVDPLFHHALGDFDYSLRAVEMGVKCYVAPFYIGTCEKHVHYAKWCSPTVTLKGRLQNLYTSTCECYPPHFFVFEKRHMGLKTAIKHYFTVHLRALMPSIWANNTNFNSGI